MTGKATGFALLLTLLSPAGGTDAHRCATGPAVVSADAEGAPDVVCRAAREAATRLAACGLVARRPVSVRVVRDLGDECPPHALGYYDARTQEVIVPTYNVCVRLAGPDGRFGVALSPEMYRSLIVHELTHAITHQLVHPRKLERTAYEYVAYAIQFTAMDPEVSAQILRQQGIDGPVGVRDLSDTYFSLSPARFAVKAYLHFRDPANGCGFLHDVIAGRVKLPVGHR